MQLNFQRDKYSGRSGDPDVACGAFCIAIATSILGGIGCCLTYLVGEVILEYTDTHEGREKHGNFSALNDLARMGVIGGLIVNLGLYISILIYACKLDPKRLEHTRNNNVTGLELIFGERPSERSGCCVIFSLLAIHVSNMLMSGSVGYWIYTRNHKSALNAQQSMESLAVGIAVTMLPFCIFNLALTMAYSDFSFITSYRPTPMPRYIPLPPRQRTERDLLEEIAANSADTNRRLDSLSRSIARL